MRIFASLAFFLFAITSARANQLIVNGGFETGSLSGWTTTSTGDGGFTVTSAAVTPLNFNATVGANSGSFYAVSDDFNGSQIQYLTQTFTTPNLFQSATLSFAIFVNDVYGADFGSAGPGGSVALLNSTGTVIKTLYGPTDTFENPGTPNPYVLYNQDISSYLTGNTTYQLQFSSSDVSGPLNVGVDDVSLVTTAAPPVITPEPSTLSLLATGGALVFWFARRKSLVASV